MVGKGVQKSLREAPTDLTDRSVPDIHHREAAKADRTGYVPRRWSPIGPPSLCVLASGGQTTAANAAVHGSQRSMHTCRQTDGQKPAPDTEDTSRPAGSHCIAANPLTRAGRARTAEPALGGLGVHPIGRGGDGEPRAGSHLKRLARSASTAQEGKAAPAGEEPHATATSGTTALRWQARIATAGMASPPLPT